MLKVAEVNYLIDFPSDIENLIATYFMLIKVVQQAFVGTIDATTAGTWDYIPNYFTMAANTTS
jgi:hypothetical protein